MSQEEPQSGSTGTEAQGTSYQMAELQLRREQFEWMKQNAREQAAAGRQQMWVSAATIAVPLLAAVLAYASARQNQLEAMKAEYELKELEMRGQFELRAGEIAMAGRSYDVKGRAAALKALFGDQLPPGFAASFDPEKHGWGRDSKLEVMRLMAAHPEQREIILTWYKALFPDDTFVARLPAER